MMTDTLHVVHARAAGIDVHKMQITASVRRCGKRAVNGVIDTRGGGLLGAEFKSGQWG